MRYILAVASTFDLTSSVAAQSAALSGGLRMDPDAVKEFKVPWPQTTPRDPFADQHGHVWFVGQMGNYVAMLDPAVGEFKRYQIDAGTYPHNLVVDRQNGIWFTGNRNGRIVHLDPETGKLKTYMMPDTSVRDPHTMIFDAKGRPYFDEFGTNKHPLVRRLHPRLPRPARSGDGQGRRVRDAVRAGVAALRHGDRRSGSDLDRRDRRSTQYASCVRSEDASLGGVGADRREGAEHRCVT